MPHTILDNIAEAKTMTERLEVLVAVRIYRDRHGRLPKTLEEVVAEGLLDGSPINHHDGSELSFDPASGKLSGGLSP